MKLKMLSIIGLILFISGTAITTYVTISYRNSSIKAREEIKTQNEKISKLTTKIDSTTLENNKLNKEVVGLSIENKKLSEETKSLSEETKELSIENKSLNTEIRSLSNRLGQQSKVIEAQITGGESYIISELKKPDPEFGSRTYYLQIENKFENPIHNLEVHLFNIDEINQNCKKEKDGVSYLIKDCYEKNQLIIKQGQVDPYSRVSLTKLKIGDNDSSNYYNLTAYARNGRYQHKIFVDRVDGIIMGYVIQIEKDNKVIDRYSKLLIFGTGYQIDESKIDFKENYKFIDTNTQIRRE